MKRCFTRKQFRFFARVLLALWLVYVLSNSMQTATVSGEHSSRIRELFNSIFGTHIGNAFVRKAAHVVEYCVFGVLGTCSVIPERGNYSISRLYRVASLLLLVALSDETVQLFFDGRAGEVRDIWIDAAGFVTGIALTAIVCRIVESKKGRKNNGNAENTL